METPNSASKPSKRHRHRPHPRRQRPDYPAPIQTAALRQRRHRTAQPRPAKPKAARHHQITGVWLDDNAANRLALFAPKPSSTPSTTSKSLNKRRLTLPDEIAEVFRCPNTNCASHGEPVKSRFYVKHQGGHTKLKCRYCEKNLPATGGVGSVNTAKGRLKTRFTVFRRPFAVR